MKLIRPALTAALLVLVLPAQGRSAKAAPKGLDQLTAEWKAANTAYRAASAKVRATDEYKAARKDRDNATLRKLMSSLKRPDAKVFGDRALTLADQYAGEEGLQVLAFVANNLYDKGVFTGMVERVEKNYINSPNLDAILENGMALNHFIGAEKTASLLSRIAAENTHEQPRAWAMYWQSTLITRDKGASDDDKAEAQELLNSAEKLAAGTVLGDKIAAPRFQKARLQIGMVAPEIEGVDPQGVAFKLSDYRGKVVVLDFWGFW